MQQDATFEMPAGGAKLISILRESDRLQLDAIQEALRQNDSVSLDPRQTMELDPQ